jgi:hypothetical protein
LAVQNDHWKLVESLVKTYNIPKVSIRHAMWYTDLKANESGAQHTVLRLWNAANCLKQLHKPRPKFEHDQLILNKRPNRQNIENSRIEGKMDESGSLVFEPTKSRVDFKLLLD